MRRVFSVVVLVVAGFCTVYGQASKSPLSSQGIGDLNDLSMIHNEGMAGLGISAGNFWYMNPINPALLPMNTLTVFGAGFTMERRSIMANNASSVNSGGNLSYLGTAFPIIGGRWTTAIGLAPYSTVEYNFVNRSHIPGTEQDQSVLSYNGTGGFNQFYWSNGFKIGKSFYLGARANYLFSSIIRENTSYAENDSLFSVLYQAALYDRISVSDLKFTLGAVFSKDSIFNGKTRLNVGVMYDFASEVNATQFKTLERRSLVGIPFESDTLVNNEKGSIYLPSSYGFGLSFSKDFHWLVGVDVRMSNWSDYKRFDGTSENLSDGLRIALGGEYTPDYVSVSNYFQRITYRAGASYELLPHTIYNENDGVNYQVEEVGINFGLSLPVGRFSSVDFAMKYGKRGKIEETTIQEEVLRFGLGITFNDQWFIRRKYD